MMYVMGMARMAHLALSGAKLLVAVTLGLLLALVPPAMAHETTIVDLRVQEVAPGDYIWSWGVPAKGKPVNEDLRIDWPSTCESRGQGLRCGAAGLAGTVTINGVGKSYSAVLMRLYRLDGQTEVYTLTDANPRVKFQGSQAIDLAEVTSTYSVLGVEHILTGWDHLLFVIGLLMLVEWNRRLFWTITAFTAAHSVTLAASALGWIQLRQGPVEACIALSIVLVASEALRTRQTAARRWPALVAFLFGLVHGLGFAGALREIGLPPQHLGWALLSFNLGVEAGQVLVLSLCGALILLVRSTTQHGVNAPHATNHLAWRNPQTWRTTAIYAVGSLACYWSLERLATLITHA